MPEIRDITDPTEFIPEPSTPWWVWGLIACGVLLIAGIIVIIVRKRKPAKARRSLLDKARTKLAKLRKQAESLPPHTIATRTSMVIRHYLETAFDDPALFETNEEFTLRPNALEALHPDARQQVTDHLQDLSHLKYEPNKDQASSTERALQLIGDAEKLLAHIELHP